MPAAEKKISDYFAELYVAGKLADAGWNIYFPHRDEGFDFIISKTLDEGVLLRPVQVKGKYPFGGKTDKPTYGYVGRLSQSHPEMVLAIVYFSSHGRRNSPECVAFMPQCQIKKHSRGYRCQPALFKSGEPKPRRDYSIFFDSEGISRLESPEWKGTRIP